MDEYVCLRFWHGGLFRRDRQEYLEYVGGEESTFKVDPDELCWWYLVELVKKCGKYVGIEHIYYCLPGQKLDVGLRRVYNDKEVLEMAAIVIKEKCIDLYVEHGIDQPEIIYFLEGSLEGVPPNEPNLNEPIVPGPNEPIVPGPNEPNNSDQPTLADSLNQPMQPNLNEPIVPGPLNHPNEPNNSDQPTVASSLNQPMQPNPDPTTLGESTEQNDECYSSESDRLYEPETEGSDDDLRELDLEEEVFSADEELRDGEDVWETVNQSDEGDSSDDELRDARERVKGCCSKLYELAQQLQKEAAEGKLGASISTPNVQEVEDSNEQGYVSEYEESDEAELTPGDSEDDDVTGRKRRQRRVPAGVGILVGNDGSTTYYSGRMQTQGSQSALGLGSQASTSTSNHPSVHGP